jgi:hypothetical protein
MIVFPLSHSPAQDPPKSATAVAPQNEALDVLEKRFESLLSRFTPMTESGRLGAFRKKTR